MPNGTTSPRNETPARCTITIAVGGAHIADLQRLPWYKPLDQWRSREARFLEVRSGLSRHVVRFIRSRHAAYAIKETTAEVAGRELESYLELTRRGIPTLIPIGTVIRQEGVMAVPTKTGSQPQPVATGYLITQVLEFSLPNYHLFKRAFTTASRRRIWDAIVRLFVQLHCRGVYWGDASLSNMMIVFVKQHFPEIGIRTVLRAYLADAETVEFHPGLSKELRRADVDYFLESMAWTEADMKASGIIREPLMTQDDQRYILNRYLDLYDIEREEQSFEIITKIDVDALLGPFEQKGQAKALLQHIYEHKWYFSEREGREVPVEEAARDWYVNVFKPVLIFFKEFEILDEFPERTASSLYLDIMFHKHLLSEQMGRDIGLVGAFEEYAKQFRQNDRTMKKLNGVTSSIRALLGLRSGVTERS